MYEKSTILTFALRLFFLSFGFLLFIQKTGECAGNPILWADVPDPSVIRVGDVYYMSSTTMHMNPGVPIMKSEDLVNWETINYAYDILADNDALTMKNGKNAYGKGSWASSLRYNNGTFYLVTFSYTTDKTHIYQTDDIENGPWSAYTLNTLCHDPSLLFDNDRVFLVYGVDDIKIIELTADATAIQPGGLNQVIIPKASQIAGSNFIVTAEGSHIYKIDEKYYLFLISWPTGSMRTELVCRAENLTGPYEGRIVLKDDGIAQGGLVDTPGGDWYALLFQDHGSVGRIPFLVPVTWEEDWPVFGVNNHVPDQIDIAVENDLIPGIVDSDEFDWDSDFPMVWQWNHNPDHNGWSVTERPGYLRLKNKRIDTNFVNTQNTLTQRTFGPECSGQIAMDISHMKDGDVAGLGALQEVYGFVGVKLSGTSKSVVMVNASSDETEPVESYPITQDIIYLKIAFNFKYKRDQAYFYYSLDGDEWISIGNTLNMSYTLSHFMGYRLALFNYATKSTDGFVDVDYFRIDDSLTGSTDIKGANEKVPTGFIMNDNYPNPFNWTTVIHYQLPIKTKMSLKVYHCLGKVVTTLVEDIQQSGNYELNFNGSELTSGVYLCQPSAGSFVKTKKLILSK